MQSIRVHRILAAFVLISILAMLGAFVPTAKADTPVFPIFDGYPKQGCFGYVVGSTGMWDGRGTISVNVPGPVVDAWLIWEGVNDTNDPGNPDTTTLEINGQTVVGQMTDHSKYSTVHADWYQWVANVGPSGYDLVSQGTNTFDVFEWWPLDTYRDGSGSFDPRRNGVSLMVIYDRSPCSDPVEIVPYFGSDYIWWQGDPQFDGGPLTENHVFTFDPAPIDRQAHLVINFAGVSHTAPLAGICRDTAIWAAVGTGTPPSAIVQTGYPGSRGINGGVLVGDNLFNISPPCTQATAYPLVDFEGGFVGAEWSTTDLVFDVPAGDEWLAVQLESVSTGTPPSRPGGESGAWTGGIFAIPLPPPELVLDKDDGQTTAAPGDLVTYTLSFDNVGAGPAFDVVMTDTLPAFTTFQSCTTSAGTCSESGGVVTFDIGTLAAGDGGTATVIVRYDDAFPVGTTDVVNRAVISTTTNGDDPTNNEAEDVTSVTATAALAITKADAPDPVQAGELLTYTLSWDISGNAFVNDTTITDALPAEVTFVSASDGGSYDAASHTVRWDLGTRYPGTQTPLSLVVRVKERILTNTPITNTARLSVSDAGVDPAQSSAVTTVQSPYLPGAIGDTVWHDLDGNGVRDAGEPGIGGVTVDLYLDGNNNGVIDAADTFVARATTDMDGHYLFERLITDNYLVTVSDVAGALAGMTKTSGTVGVDNNSQPDPYAVALGNGETNLTADFGYTAGGGMGGGTAVSIGDLVWRDENGNGVYEAASEVGIRGVTLRLYRDLNGNGTIDASDASFGSVTTDRDGHYLFYDLPPDKYVVDVTDENHVLTFFTLTTANDPAAVDVSGGSDNLDVDFGYQPTGPGQIGDMVFYDKNDDGIQQGDETGLADVLLHLFDPGTDGACGGGDDTLLAATWTDASGMYTFLGLPAGDYCVHVAENTLPNANLTLGSHFSNPYGPIALADGEHFMDADFGYTAAAIEGTVFNDANGNGSQDAGEGGISGAGVCLYASGGTAPLECTTTGSDGGYSFLMLAAGDYNVQLSSWPSGYEPTTAASVAVTAPLGSVARADFGLARPDFSVTKAFDVTPTTPLEVGQEVTFTVEVMNTGGTALSVVPLSDTFDPTYLEFVRASIAPDGTTPAGTLTWNDLTGAGDLAAGDHITVKVVFRALAETAQTTNTATVSGVRSAGGQTLPDKDDQVSFAIVRPDFSVTKAFDVPVGTPIKVEVGDVVTFTVTVENTGGTPLTEIPLTDTFDPTYLRFLRADVAPDSTASGTLSWTDLTGSGSLAPGSSLTIRVTFEALAETSSTTNTATVSGVRSAGGQTLPDKSDSLAFSIQAPTAVTMADILAEFDGSGSVILTWVTTAEFDNWGFNVYRAEVDDPEQAVRINDTLIPGRGQSVSGATYRFIDRTVEPGKTYWYWIEDVELTGKTAWHGPVEVYVPDVLEPGDGAGHTFLPFILQR